LLNPWPVIPARAPVPTAQIVGAEDAATEAHILSLRVASLFAKTYLSLLVELHKPHPDPMRDRTEFWR